MARLKTIRDEAQLLEEARNHSEAAYGELLARYRASVFRIALARTGNAADAEDVTLETFVKAFQHLDQFRGEASFSTWVGRITVNECRSSFRRRGANRCESLDEALERDEGFLFHQLAIREEDPEQWYSRQELKRIIWQALDSLPVPYRVVLIVREIYGFSTKEAAAVLAVSATAVRIRAFRARLMLREKLGRLFGRPSLSSFSGSPA